MRLPNLEILKLAHFHFVRCCQYSRFDRLLAPFDLGSRNSFMYYGKMYLFTPPLRK